MGYYYEEERYKPSKFTVAIIALILIAVGYNAINMTIDRFGGGPKDTLTVGMNAPYEPFEVLRDGKVVGFDADMAEKIGDRLGRKVTYKNFDSFGGVLPSLETNATDVVISAVSITPARSMAFDFSVPYFNSSQALLVPVGKTNFKGSGTLAAADFEGMRIGYQEKTTSQEWVETDLAGITLAKNQSFADLDIAVQNMKMGAFDGVVMDSPVAEAYARDNPQYLAVAGTMGSEEQYGIAVRKCDPQNLLPEINAVIEEMKTNGEYDEMIKEHFGGEN